MGRERNSLEQKGKDGSETGRGYNQKEGDSTARETIKTPVVTGHGLVPETLLIRADWVYFSSFKLIFLLSLPGELSSGRTSLTSRVSSPSDITS